MPPFIDREKLGLDLAKIYWNPDMAGQHPVGRASQFRRSIDRRLASAEVPQHARRNAR